MFLFENGITIGDDYAANISDTAVSGTTVGLNSNPTRPPYLRDLVPGMTTETTNLRNHYKITSNSTIPDQGSRIQSIELVEYTFDCWCSEY